MVSPAVQGQERHPSIVPEFLRSTSCGMTSARGHGAIVYYLNSGSEERQTGRHNSKGFVKGILETGDVMDKCVQMWTRNYGALGQTARETRGDREREETEREKKRVGESESGARLEWRKGLSPEIGVKKTMNAGDVENGNMN
ncbi:hypothetical protein TNCV_3331201 [Trichonephila clavipes]|nr:hypothetical protein TNCV_3331201 [Trichonephila clavipes]